jgi:putative addiction module CopG family antidote
MRPTRALSITLPDDMARMVKNKVASGEYTSESEVIRDGLRVLQARGAALETCLRNEAAKSYDEYKAEPGIGIPAAQISAGLNARHRLRLAKTRKK